MRLTTGYFAAPSSLDSLAIMRLSLWLKRTIPMSAADPLNPKVPDGLVDLQDTALQAQGLPGPQVHPKALSILRNSVKWCSVFTQNFTSPTESSQRLDPTSTARASGFPHQIRSQLVRVTA